MVQVKDEDRQNRNGPQPIDGRSVFHAGSVQDVASQPGICRGDGPTQRSVAIGGRFYHKLSRPNTHLWGAWPCWPPFAVLATLTAICLGVRAGAAEPTEGGRRPPGFPAQVAGLRELSRQSYPETLLRGYGRLSAEEVRYASAGEPQASASLLAIRAADADKARLVEAKFTGDLSRTGGTAERRLAVGDRQVPCIEVEGQGWMAVIREEKTVWIAAARRPPQMAALLRAAAMAGPAVSPPGPAASVPMYLDSWDRYGFRFYYRAWETPKGVRWPSYHALEEFDFARRSGDCGFIYWAEPSQVDTAAGLTNNVYWDWAARAATRRHLPVIVNTSIASPTWLVNRYRDQGMNLQPQYCGSYHGVADAGSAGMRRLSWCATTAQDAELGVVQRIVRQYAAQPETLEFLEPHGELRHGDYDIFLEYGPVADESYRTYLRTRYADVAALGRRWYGDAGRLRSWDEVHVPEVASFLGYGPQALDLTGTWRVGYEKFADGKSHSTEELQSPGRPAVATEPAPAAWFQNDFDDHDWPAVAAPGNDRAMFLPKRPAVYRQSFEVAADWLKASPRVWLYVWDLNYGEHLKEHMRADLNGRTLGEDLLRHGVPHWCALEATAALRAGRNTLALRLPQGYLAYRVYLSPHPPEQYPDLGPNRNAQWVDLADWRRWSRLNMVRRGMEMIRQADPDRSIICMAPDRYVSGIKQLCEQYGGHFHNTGYMGAWWAEYLPMLMRGSDLPFSLEPGSPAGSLGEFKNMVGLYLTEGIQAIHYFIHVGSILWNDDIRRHFESVLPLLHTLGTMHPPKAEVAMLFSDRVDDLSGYPWGQNLNVNLPSGYFRWPLSREFLGRYGFDGLTDLDMLTARARPYRMIVDCNTSIMDERLLGAIEAWVRGGGIFVTFVQTGRHTPEVKDAWPISRLSGYQVQEVSPYQQLDGQPQRWWRLRWAPGQAVFAAGWDLAKAQANGLKLRRRDPACRDLMLWEDGSVAAGLRPLGRGYVVHLGLKFCRDRLWADGTDQTRRLFEGLLRWARIAAVPAEAPGVTFRHYLSNNGLYDYWVLWNQEAKKDVDTRLTLLTETGRPMETCLDVQTGRSLALTAAGQRRQATPPLHLAPLEVRMFRTPREQIASAPAAWYVLQTQWWRGTTAAPSTPLPEVDGRHVLDLSRGWAYRVLPEQEDGKQDDGRRDDGDAARLAASGTNWEDWPRRDLNCWAVPEELPSRHVLLRRRVEIPPGWDRGEVTLWIKSWVGSTFVGQGRVWLDGQEIASSEAGVIQPLDAKPGQRHELAIEIRGQGDVVGSRGNAWLAYTPTPLAQLDLAGMWTPSSDMLRELPPARLPGTLSGAHSARRSIALPPDWHDKQAYLCIRGGPRVTGALVNGRYVRRHHHALGETTLLNITPWLKAGQPNEIELLFPEGKCQIERVGLWAYDAENQP